jgi:hypothetical protein
MAVRTKSSEERLIIALLSLARGLVAFRKIKSRAQIFGVGVCLCGK